MSDGGCRRGSRRLPAFRVPTRRRLYPPAGSANPPGLPELRNLGTLLRILLAVNGAAVVTVFARESRWEALSDAWIETAAFVEPHLLLWAIAVLFAAYFALHPIKLALGVAA